MEINAENLNGLSGYLEQTLKPEVHLRKPAEDFLKTVENQKGYAILLLTLLSPENPTDPSIKVAAAIAFKNYVKRNWKVVIQLFFDYAIITVITLITSHF
jgi:exportin-2 (importin alpha re-exporter)